MTSDPESVAVNALHAVLAGRDNDVRPDDIVTVRRGDLCVLLAREILPTDAYKRLFTAMVNPALPVETQTNTYQDPGPQLSAWETWQRGVVTSPVWVTESRQILPLTEWLPPEVDHDA